MYCLSHHIFHSVTLGQTATSLTGAPVPCSIFIGSTKAVHLFSEKKTKML